MLRNPFEIKNPEVLSADEICALFVKDFTEYNSLTSFKHTFAYGCRGSGKSMQFRFLEPRCQAIEKGGLHKFLDEKNAFIGIYIKCNRGSLMKQEFDSLLLDQKVSQIVASRLIIHYFIMDITEHILTTFGEQLKELIDDESKQERIFERIFPTLDKKNIHSSSISNKNLASLLNIVRNEKDLVDQSITDYFSRSGLPNNTLEYSGNLCDITFAPGAFLRELVVALREIVLLKNVPFFLFFDDADALSDFQKKIINTLISQRIQDTVCVKVSSQPISYNVDVNVDNRQIEETHDYYVIDFDSLYTNNRFNYYDRIHAIANKRLSVARFTTTEIRDFLPENLTDIEKRKEAEVHTGEEYDRMEEEQRPLERTNYIKKYSMARFLQKYFKKTVYGYAGFDNLVHFSSGIIRFFLEPCFWMVERYAEEHPEEAITTIKLIPFKMQEEAIRNFSNEYIDKQLVEPLRMPGITTEEKETLESLLNLLEALGAVFKIRLMNDQSREPRIISFAVKGSISDLRLRNVLQLAVRKAFLHKKWYRAKSGYEMLECYILNRRLCPRYGIDLSGFQGRLELTEQQLLMALQNRDSFISSFKAREKSQPPAEEAEQLVLMDF